MVHIRKFSIILVLCLVLALLPVTSVNAAESGSIWMRQIPYNGVTIAVCADAAVASGVVTITYNKDVLTFTELKVDSQYVLAHAANDKEAGTIKISWIGTGERSNADGYVLMWLEFEGPADLSAVMNGTVYDASGNTIAITTLNLTGVTAAIMQAETLKAENYTTDSFATMQSAMQAANAMLERVAVTQGQLDAATQALVTAMENLVVFTPEPPPTQPPATEPAPTEPAPTEPEPTDPTQPGSTPAKPDPTQPSTQEPTIAPKRDNSWMLIALAAVLAVAVVAAVVILKKRGRK